MIKKILLIILLWLASFSISFATGTSVWWGQESWGLTLGWHWNLWNPTQFSDFSYTWPGGVKMGTLRMNYITAL